MKILVTGGAGFVGSHIVDNLIENKHEVIVLDNLSTGDISNLNKNAKFYKEDIKNKDKIEEIFQIEKPEIVYHTAAQVNVRESISNPIMDAQTNIIGSLNLIEECKKNKVKKIIFSSSAAVYSALSHIPTSETEPTEPTNPYGVAKLTVEKYLKYYKHSHNLDFVILRYSNVYGPRQSNKGEAGVVSIFVNKILNKNQITINGAGDQTRDFIFVEDVARASILALNLEGIYNVSTGKESSINEIFSLIKKYTNSGVIASHAPAIFGELRRSILNPSKIKEKGWESTELKEGLKKTADWFKNQGFFQAGPVKEITRNL
ncbi:MAG: NAD-dependent epimerase/dehydratase family protein [Candidatus Omnitrophica bacterium]|nr:NAD-dependent epimerase/dehydratase family protein [Candidatus Omnitrophota bacterium]